MPSFLFLKLSLITLSSLYEVLVEFSITWVGLYPRIANKNIPSLWRQGLGMGWDIIQDPSRADHSLIYVDAWIGNFLLLSLDLPAATLICEKSISKNEAR